MDADAGLFWGLTASAVSKIHETIAFINDFEGGGAESIAEEFDLD